MYFLTDIYWSVKPCLNLTPKLSVYCFQNPAIVLLCLLGFILSKTLCVASPYFLSVTANSKLFSINASFESVSTSLIFLLFFASNKFGLLLPSNSTVVTSLKYYSNNLFSSALVLGAPGLIGCDKFIINLPLGFIKRKISFINLSFN